MDEDTARQAVSDVAGSMSMEDMEISASERIALHALAVGTIDFAGYCELVGLRPQQAS